MDSDIEQFGADVLKSILQMKQRKAASVHTPVEIQARRGRPKGSVMAGTKVAVKLRLDPDVLQAMRASGPGWQTRTNDFLRQHFVVTGASTLTQVQAGVTAGHWVQSLLGIREITKASPIVIDSTASTLAARPHARYRSGRAATLTRQDVVVETASVAQI